MARINRRDVLSDSEIQVVHCVSRCVRRGYLCGRDVLTGRDYGHRREWIRRRLEFLAGIFGVDVIGFSVMTNHLHVVVRNRPDVVRQWTDEEVARRWLTLFPMRRNKDGSPVEPEDVEVQALVADADNLSERRRRLANISWFMRCTSEVIARLANAEDECTGRFWEGRFKAQVLPDEAAITACMVYVELNPIRAGMASTPEESHFTSAQERIADFKAAIGSSNGELLGERMEHGPRAGWLAPIELEPQNMSGRERLSGRRASNSGCVFLSLPDYLRLLDWTGRQLYPGKSGVMAVETSSLPERLGMSAEIWLQVVTGFRSRRIVRRMASTSFYSAPSTPIVPSISAGVSA
jgi:REP element-mobilizing transposase RayT